MLLSIMVVVALAWLSAVALLWWYQERALFPAGGGSLGNPPLGSPFLPQIVEAEDGASLRFWAVEPRSGMPVILYLHGNGGHSGHREWALRPFAEAGYGVVLAEYRGYGGNPGLPTEKGLIADARAQASWASSQWPGRSLVIWGESIGTGVAVALAAERQVDGLLLDSPFTSVRQLAANLFRWAPVQLLLRHPFDSLARLPSVRAPVFVLHGKDDGIVPVEHGRTVLAAAPCPAGGAFLPGIGHPALLTDRGTVARDAAMAFLFRLHSQRTDCSRAAESYGRVGRLVSGHSSRAAART